VFEITGLSAQLDAVAELHDGAIMLSYSEAVTALQFRRVPLLKAVLDRLRTSGWSVSLLTLIAFRRSSRSSKICSKSRRSYNITLQLWTLPSI
jgi:hypothetical protein